MVAWIVSAMFHPILMKTIKSPVMRTMRITLIQETINILNNHCWWESEENWVWVMNCFSNLILECSFNVSDSVLIELEQIIETLSPSLWLCLTNWQNCHHGAVHRWHSSQKNDEFCVVGQIFTKFYEIYLILNSNQTINHHFGG